MAEKTDLAYTAGLIDGEGCIGVYPVPCKTNKTGKRYYLTLRIQMSDWESPLWLKDTFGGYYRAYPQMGYGTRTMYVWVVSAQRASKILEDILPYLKAKHRQAEMAIEFQSKMKIGKHESATVMQAQKILSDALKAEKRRATSPTS